MLIKHFGELRDLDPLQAAVEVSIVGSLRKRGPTRQRDLWYHVGGGNGRMPRVVFQAAIDSLVEHHVISREATHRRDSFILRMAPDKRRSARAAARRERAANAATEETL